jgi:hypothetical protein
MARQNYRYLLFLTKNYSYSILKPLYDEINKHKDFKVYWFSTKSERFDISQEYWLENNEDVIRFNPDVIFVPGNIVPSTWPGLKVQLFHGLGEEKHGHYRNNGLFHMYCTPGPYVTDKFLKKTNSKYIVKETGWTKIDNVHASIKNKHPIFTNDYPTILYAPTFSEKLTSALLLLDQIKSLQKRDYNWIIKFHELMNASLITQYKVLENNNFIISEIPEIFPHMSESDLLLTDTSSVAYEYIFFNKPIVTFNAKARIDKGINISKPNELEGAIIRALSNPDEFKENREFYISELHPYQDWKSSLRVLESVNKVLKNGYKPLNKYDPKYLLSRWKTKNLVRIA